MRASATDNSRNDSVGNQHLLYNDNGDLHDRLAKIIANSRYPCMLPSTALMQALARELAGMRDVPPNRPAPLDWPARLENALETHHLRSPAIYRGTNDLYPRFYLRATALTRRLELMGGFLTDSAAEISDIIEKTFSLEASPSLLGSLPQYLRSDLEQAPSSGRMRLVVQYLRRMLNALNFSVRVSRDATLNKRWGTYSKHTRVDSAQTDAPPKGWIRLDYQNSILFVHLSLPEVIGSYIKQSVIDKLDVQQYEQASREFVDLLRANMRLYSHTDRTGTPQDPMPTSSFAVESLDFVTEDIAGSVWGAVKAMYTPVAGAYVHNLDTIAILCHLLETGSEEHAPEEDIRKSVELVTPIVGSN